MNIMELGAIGELVGGVAVIASLIYVGLQIRQSARATHTGNHQAGMALWVALTSPLHSDPELSALFARGLDDADSLSRDERIRVHFLLLQLVLFFKDSLDAWEAGILDTPTFHAWEEFIASILAKPGGRLWWDSAGGIYIAKVRSRLTRALEIATPYDSLEFLRA